MAKKIYATFDVENYDFKRGDGQYEIYNSYSLDSITFSDIKTSEASDILRFSTNNGKDLVITRTDSKKDKIVLKDWFTYYADRLDKFRFMDSFGSEDYKTQISIGAINISGKGTIKDTFSSDIIKGSKKSDKIYSSYGNDTVIGGKGNDYIVFNSDGLNKIVMNKGDGNDTLEINSEISSTYIEYIGDVDISYTKDGNNLIISGKHAGKKSKTEKVTIEDYFTDSGKIGNLKIYLSDDTENNIIVKNAVTNALNIKGQKFKDLYIGTGYYFEGTDYDDIFKTINNKYNAIYTAGGNNTVYTSKKSFSFISGGNGNDTYIINSLATITEIDDSGGYDLLDIKGAGRNDLYLISDVQLSPLESTDILLLTNSKGANKLKKFKIKSNDNEFSLIKRNINGVVLSVESGSLQIEDVTISKGNNSEVVQGIDDVLSELDNDVRTYLRSLKDSNGDYKYLSALELLTMGSKKERNALINLYKNYRIGTNGNNSYTIGSSKTYIASGEGSDNFTFKGKYGDTIINSVTDSGTRDKIIIKNYALEKANLELILSDNGEDLIIASNEWNKKTKTRDFHTITYKNFQTTNNNLVLRDSKREYELLYSDSEIIKDWSNLKTNHIIYGYGNKNVSVNLSKGYNFVEVNQGSNVLQNEYSYNGGHCMINSYSLDSADTYNVNNFSKTTDLSIFDYGGNDSLNIYGDIDKIRLFMNVNQSENIISMYDDTDINWFITDKSNLTVTSVKKGFSGIEIDGNTNCIENIKIGDTSVDIEKWVDGIRHNVGSWLSTYKNGKYVDVMSVISSGNKSDITALIAKYNEVDYNSIANINGGL